MKNEKIEYTYIGGQAVMEGVMMRGKTMYAMAVRHSSGEINETKKAVAEPPAWQKLPIIRGIMAFINSLVLGMKLIYDSADMAGIDLKEENPSKFDLWLERKFGDKLMGIIMGIGVVLGIVFSVGLFMLLPVGLTSFLGDNIPTQALGIIEGVIRIVIFLGYLAIVAQSKDIKRLFQYHGAEHKTISCYEHNEALTVDNVRKHSRLHKRCGTSFLLIVMIVSMIFFTAINVRDIWIRLVTRVLFVPLIAGVSYEIIKWAGKSDFWLVNAISYPGLMLQKLTTKEPDDGQIECAIRAMSAVIEKEIEKKQEVEDDTQGSVQDSNNATA